MGWERFSLRLNSSRATDPGLDNLVLTQAEFGVTAPAQGPRSTGALEIHGDRFASSTSSRKAHTSLSSSIRSCSDEPMPWPLLELVRSRMGFFPLFAARSEEH